MNIVITAGGTSEYIDSVRKITNSGSGKLASIIVDNLKNREDITNIFYIHTPKAIKPVGNKIKYIEVINTNDLKNTVIDILKNNNIDWFIHGMAVSDYYVDYVSTINMLASEINSNTVKEVLNNPKNRLDNKNKISSYEDNLVVVLKQTPKIISLIKDISPSTKLIGFKLLTDVSKDELFEVAYKLLIKNDCEYVIANDLKEINETNHVAYLIDKNKQSIRMETKQEIAENLNYFIK